MNFPAKNRRTKPPVREDLKEGYVYSIVQTNRLRDMAFAPAPGQVLQGILVLLSGHISAVVAFLVDVSSPDTLSISPLERPAIGYDSRG
jgi:hypothetical protein